MLPFNEKINFWDNYYHEKLSSVAGTIQQWSGKDCPSSYKEVSKNKDIVTYTMEDFKYIYNSHGFRSCEFDNSEKIKILYGGCSLTEGVGLPLDHVWFSIINKKISNLVNAEVKPFNVGVGGFSIDAIVRMVYITIEHKKFMPDMVCLLLPTVLRQECLTVGTNNNQYWLSYLPSFAPTNDPKAALHHANITKLSFYTQRYHDSFRSLLMLKWYLECKNIPFFFAFWESPNFVNKITKKEISHNEMMLEDCPPELQKHYLRGSMNLKSQNPDIYKKYKYTVARDGMHPGPNAHYNMVENYTFPELKSKPEFVALIEKWKAATDK